MNFKNEALYREFCVMSRQIRDMRTAAALLKKYFFLKNRSPIDAVPSVDQEGVTSIESDTKREALLMRDLERRESLDLYQSPQTENL